MDVFIYTSTLLQILLQSVDNIFLDYIILYNVPYLFAYPGLKHGYVLSVIVSGMSTAKWDACLLCSQGLRGGQVFSVSVVRSV